jgi:hypothetical protein
MVNVWALPAAQAIRCKSSLRCTSFRSTPGFPLLSLTRLRQHIYHLPFNTIYNSSKAPILVRMAFSTPRKRQQ